MASEKTRASRGIRRRLVNDFAVETKKLCLVDKMSRDLYTVLRRHFTFAYSYRCFRRIRFPSEKTKKKKSKIGDRVVVSVLHRDGRRELRFKTNPAVDRGGRGIFRVTS